MTGDHPTDWPTRHVQAKALREAAADLQDAAKSGMAGWAADASAAWLNARADGLEQR